MAGAIAHDVADFRLSASTKVAVSKSPDSHTAEALVTSPGGAEAIRDGLSGKYVCPFCGSVNDSEQGMCPRCTMENSAATRKATKTRIGPWYVLQTRNPAAPGMTWDTLLSFIRKGRVKPRSIVRGPTTHQLWRFAAQVKGLSREFGICYSCGSGIETSASLCPTCNRLQEPPPNPDALLEASREGQGQAYGQSPATINGNVLAAAGPATIVGQLTPSSLAAEPPVNEGDFVIPALGADSGVTSVPGAGTGLASAKVTPGLLSTGPATPAPPPQGGGRGAPAAAAGQPTRPPAGNRNKPPAVSQPITPQHLSPQHLSPQTPPDFSGISGDASWAKIPNAPGRQGGPRQAARPPANGAPAFNPYADDDAPGRRTNDAEGFLSAKDLAAAFNLGFVGEDDDVPVQRTVRQPANQAAGGRGPGGPGPTGYPPPRRKRFGFFKFIFLLILLGGIGFGVACVLEPELLERTKEKVREIYDNLSKETPADKLGDRPRKETPAPTVVPPGADSPVSPATRPSPAPAPNGTSATKPAGPAAGTPTPPPAALGAENAQKAWNEAADLEDVDPRQALEKYKKIKADFPQSDWPTLLESSIRRVEKRLGIQPG